MHELTVIENIMNISFQAAKENKLNHIEKINLRVGKLQHLNEMIMQNAFSAAKADTPAARAELIILRSPVQLICQDCNHEFRPENNNFHCPACNSTSTKIVKGNELYVESIEGG
ncbi:MAG: hydrogenase maturation nickel metallochaperone HypA [bacterium]